jgi:hypothetical protein
LQNSIQDRCRNTEVVTKSMLKHGSCYTVRGCICRNTKQLHGSRTMLKHRSCHSELQMLRHSGDRYDAETRTLTVSSQGRHSQGAQFTWLKQPVNCDAETASAAMSRSRYTSRNSDALFSPVLAFGCMRIGYPMLI